MNAAKIAFAILIALALSAGAIALFIGHVFNGVGPGF